ncbi:hypothetical protein JAO29_21790 [Edaphobacter sp. HDX4]|uniref:hypothetical protein n=1 Tax=Edaphobacter sp. HDX4 TaxID=2794064 RepID=UPI002FE64FE4
MVFVGSSAAQYVKVGIDGQIPSGRLDEMNSMLEMADAGQKAGLLTRLGVENAVATDVAEHLLPGDKIELRPVRTRGTAHYGVAFLPSGTGVSCYLYLLRGSDEDSAKIPWHVIDHRQLDCWGGSSSLELNPLRSRDEDDLLLHGVTGGHGSGLVLKEMQIFSVLNGRLQETLRTEDYRSQDDFPSDQKVLEKSTFLRFPDGALEETRTSAVNDRLEKVERRYWSWSGEQQKFLANGFLKVATPTS